jgi:hypothetical protein
MRTDDDDYEATANPVGASGAWVSAAAVNEAARRGGPEIADAGAETEQTIDPAVRPKIARKRHIRAADTAHPPH